jgi:hypothetical protein
VTRIGELGTTLADAPCEEIQSLSRLLVTGHVVPRSPIIVTLMMKALRFSEISVLTSATRRTIPEDAIFAEFVSIYLDEKDDLLHVEKLVRGNSLCKSIRVTRIGELGTLAVTSNRRTLRRTATVERYV